MKVPNLFDYTPSLLQIIIGFILFCCIIVYADFIVKMVDFICFAYCELLVKEARHGLDCRLDYFSSWIPWLKNTGLVF